MVILILQRVPTTLRGEVSRWLAEVHTGVFIGHVSALVREALFERCQAGMRDGGVLMIVPAATEQGYRIHTAGNVNRAVVDMDGLQLIRIPRTGKKRGAIGDASDEEPPF